MYNYVAANVYSMHCIHLEDIIRAFFDKDKKKSIVFRSEMCFLRNIARV